MSRVALLLGDPARLRPVARAIVGAGGRTAAAEDAAASSASWVLALVDDVDEATRAGLRALAAQRPGSPLTLVLGAALPPEGWRALSATPQVTQALALEGPWLSELLLTASCGATELDMVGRCSIRHDFGFIIFGNFRTHHVFALKLIFDVGID